MAVAKSARREVRLTPQDNDLLVEAAGLAGVSVSEFVVEHAVADAEALVRTHHTIELSDDHHHRRFIAALDEVAPSERFTETIRRARRLEHSEHAG